jgi:hypothetical protein
MRFKKSVTGLSSTLGCKGFSLSLGKNGVSVNTGIPSTGSHDRIKIDIPGKKEIE